MSLPNRLYDQLMKVANRQARNRVYWLLGALLVAWLITFVENQLGEQNMHALAGLFVGTGVSPVALLHSWYLYDGARWQVAFLEVLLDTLLFLPAYLFTLAIWCRYYAENSLFVANTYHRNVVRAMRWLGRVLVAGVMIAATADLLENGVMIGWLFGQLNPFPAWLLGAIRLTKMVPIALALFYILLHPLGFVFALREAFFRLFGVTRYDQESARQRLIGHINKQRQLRQTINEQISQLPVAAEPPLRAVDYLKMAWRGFLNVQFVVYLLLFMGFIFLQLDQFDELFYFLLTEDRGAWVLLLTMPALALWGGMVYVCSKILLFVQPNYFGELEANQVDITAQKLNEQQPQLRVLRNVPVWLAHGPFLILFITLAVNFSRLSADEQRNPDYVFKYVLILLAIAATYLVFVILIRYFHRSLNERDIVLFKPGKPDEDYALLVDLAPRSILYGQGLLVLTLMLFLPTATGLSLSQIIGLYAVVMLWLAAVAYLGTILYQFNHLPDYPVLAGLILLVLLFSQNNDNSDIRLSPPAPIVTTAVVSQAGKPTSGTLVTAADVSLALQRPDISAYYRRWLETRCAFDVAMNPADTLPVVVVATAGGGIRAAAWTTEVLTALNDFIPDFGQHIFAISGVSGGGVGAATYVATLAGHRRNRGQGTSVPGTLQYDPANLHRPLLNAVTEDLISPIAASMLFRGGIHNFMPVPVPALDRNRWLEDAWEKRMLGDSVALDSASKLNLRQSFLRTWPTQQTLGIDSLYLPALLLNGAVAETGQKIIMTNLDLGNTTDSLNPFYDVADLFASIRSDVPYKTATFLCARFPFVTSGGKAVGPLPNIITKRCQSADYHIIDGGYAENTGLLSAVQLIKRLQRVSNGLVLRRPVKYYLLFLPNYAASEVKGTLGAFRFFTEPVKGFLSTWNRNGVSLDQLIGRTLQGSQNALSFTYTSLTLDTRRHRYPLGWYISPTAVRKMGEQVRQNLRDSLRRPQTTFSQMKRQIR